VQISDLMTRLSQLQNILLMVFGGESSVCLEGRQVEGRRIGVDL
jgi:hypothetical protein